MFEDILIKCILSTAACAAYGIQFNIRPRHLVSAAVGGFMSQFIYFILQNNGSGEVSCCFMAAAGAAVYSELLARRLRVPASMYLITSIIPLVPGGMMYYTMSALVMDDIESASELAVKTVGEAGAIAMGVFMVSSLVRFFKKAKFKDNSGFFFRSDGKKGTLKNMK